jgi:hypothetical protein
MSKLIALLVVVLAGALTAVLFFWRRAEGSWGSMWTSAKSSTTSWGDAVSHEVGKAVDGVAQAADDAASELSSLADELKGAVSQSTRGTVAAAEGAAGEAEDAVSGLADDAKGAAT